jgi:hypothetical protein
MPNKMTSMAALAAMTVAGASLLAPTIGNAAPCVFASGAPFLAAERGFEFALGDRKALVGRYVQDLLEVNNNPYQRVDLYEIQPERTIKRVPANLGNPAYWTCDAENLVTSNPNVALQVGAVTSQTSANWENLAPSSAKALYIFQTLTNVVFGTLPDRPRTGVYRDYDKIARNLTDGQFLVPTTPPVVLTLTSTTNPHDTWQFVADEAQVPSLPQ